MAIKRYMAEDVYNGIVQANFNAILRTTTKEYGSQKGLQTLYSFTSHPKSKKERIIIVSQPNFNCLTESGKK